ncbi:sigma factor-like helix-turn-helix DNA-binding protein [Streptomyces sp. NPDC086989]|uniref:sigma factor-like helix-turn-helix DNA-binding protein n=1 Tax=Streptomyces sp. NPDC086989 TaxID=3365764 RepID=UPI0006BAFF50|nr:Sigma-70 region 4 type 2 [Actinobacteria bacterium OV450]
MSTPLEPEYSASGPVPGGRPGRKLGPIATGVSSTHRAWLEPTRDRYLASGLTLAEMSGRVPLAKSKLSELMRGVGLYPRWELLEGIAGVLEMPVWPLQRLWRQAALDAQKSREWIERSAGSPPVTTSAVVPPLEHGAFRETVEDSYRRYCQVFLFDDPCEAAVADTFDLLWLSWNGALASPDMRNYAWKILRATVMAKTPHVDGRPDLGHAAFDTVALRTMTDVAAGMAQMAESLELFKAISRLPEVPLDVVVLRSLCGFTPEETSGLLGLSKPTVQSSERYAERFLDNIFNPPDTEGPTE